MGEFLRNYGPAIAWIVAAVGWFVASRQANFREERKEVRSEIEDASKLVMEILAVLRQYRTTRAGSSEAVEAEVSVKLKFQELSLRVARLKERRRPVCGNLLDLEITEETIEKFFDVATGGDFESHTRVPSQGDNEILARQATDAFAAADALHRAFLEAFAK